MPAAGAAAGGPPSTPAAAAPSTGAAVAAAKGGMVEIDYTPIEYVGQPLESTFTQFLIRSGQAPARPPAPARSCSRGSQHVCACARVPCVCQLLQQPRKLPALQTHSRNRTPAPTQPCARLTCTPCSPGPPPPSTAPRRVHNVLSSSVVNLSSVSAQCVCLDLQLPLLHPVLLLLL